MSLQSKLIIIIVLFVLLPVATSGLFFYLSSERYVKQQSANEGKQTLMLLQRNVDSVLSNYDDHLMSLYQNEALIRQLGADEGDGRQAEEVINRFLRDYLRGKDEIDSIYLFTKDASRYYFYDQKGSRLFIQQLEQHGDWLKRIQESDGRTLWLSTYEIPSNQYNIRSTYYFIGAKLIKDIFSFFEPLGSIMVNIRIDALANLMSDIQVSKNGFLLVLDADGSVIWHRNSLLLGQNIRELPLFASLQNNRSISTHKLNGELYQVVSVHSDYNGWRYVSFVPHADMQAESANIKRFMNITFLVSVLIFSLLAGLMAIFITKPLRNMVVAMNRFGKNNLKVTLDAGSKDEIGVLQQSFNSMSGKIIDLIEEVRTISAKEKEAEIKALRAQINPHFMYNTLDTINWMALEHGQVEVSKMITSLSDIMRYAIHPDREFVTVREELEWARNYVYIQKSRFEDRFTVDFIIDEQVLDYEMPRLLLQPFIENAIIHGMDEREDGGLISIGVRLDTLAGKVIFEIEDNGVGVHPDTLQHIQDGHHAGIGIRNVHDRLQLEYGTPYGVTIRSQLDQGTKVTIAIPCIRSQTGGTNDVQSGSY